MQISVLTEIEEANANSGPYLQCWESHTKLPINYAKIYNCHSIGDVAIRILFNDASDKTPGHTASTSSVSVSPPPLKRS